MTHKFSKDDVSRLLDDINRRGGDVWARQMLRWVGNTLVLTERLCTGEQNEDLAALCRRRSPSVEN